MLLSASSICHNHWRSWRQAVAAFDSDLIAVAETFEDLHDSGGSGAELQLGRLRSAAFDNRGHDRAVLCGDRAFWDDDGVRNLARLERGMDHQAQTELVIGVGDGDPYGDVAGLDVTLMAEPKDFARQHVAGHRVAAYFDGRVGRDFSEPCRGE